MTREQFSEIFNKAYWKEGEPPHWYTVQDLCKEVERLQKLVDKVHQRAGDALENGDTSARLGAALGRIHEMTRPEDES